MAQKERPAGRAGMTQVEVSSLVVHSHLCPPSSSRSTHAGSKLSERRTKVASSMKTLTSTRRIVSGNGGGVGLSRYRNN